MVYKEHMKGSHLRCKVCNKKKTSNGNENGYIVIPDSQSHQTYWCCGYEHLKEYLERRIAINNKIKANHHTRQFHSFTKKAMTTRIDV